MTILSNDVAAKYRADGFFCLPRFVDDAWLERLRAASDEFVEQSRALTKSNELLDLDDGHSHDAPRLRRLINPVDNHETFREFALDGPAADLAVALLGRPARFHHSKLNFKWSDGGAGVEWHQDIQYWPHSDFTPLTIGVYLDDVDDAMGPLGVVPGSHLGPCYDLRDAAGQWTGSLTESDAASLDLDAVEYLPGPAGSATVHNCVSVHGSKPNRSPRPRPLLLQTYSAATSFPLLGVGTNGRTGAWSGTLVGGDMPDWMTIDGRRIPVAPDWSRGGYTTIFDVQQER